MSTETLERPKSDQRSDGVYGAVVSGLLLVLVGVMLLLDYSEVIDLRASLILPSILAFLGIALIVGSFNGPHTGMVTAGVFVTLGVLVIAVTPPGAFRGGIGGQAITVTDPSDLEAVYEVGVGELSLDLSDLVLTEPVAIEARVGAGDLIIVVPPSLEVDITASASAGDVSLFGETSEGSSEPDHFTSDEFDTAPATLTLDLQVAAGDIEVSR
jgi:hypothetical protein